MENVITILNGISIEASSFEVVRVLTFKVHPTGFLPRAMPFQCERLKFQCFVMFRRCQGLWLAVMNGQIIPNLHQIHLPRSFLSPANGCLATFKTIQFWDETETLGRGLARPSGLEASDGGCTPCRERLGWVKVAEKVTQIHHQNVPSFNSPKCSKPKPGHVFDQNPWVFSFKKVLSPEVWPRMPQGPQEIRRSHQESILSAQPSHGISEVNGCHNFSQKNWEFYYEFLGICLPRITIKCFFLECIQTKHVLLSWDLWRTCQAKINSQGRPHQTQLGRQSPLRSSGWCSGKQKLCNSKVALWKWKPCRFPVYQMLSWDELLRVQHLHVHFWRLTSRCSSVSFKRFKISKYYMSIYFHIHKLKYIKMHKRFYAVCVPGFKKCSDLHLWQGPTSLRVLANSSDWIKAPISSRLNQS